MAARPGMIDHPGKIGIGTWDADKIGTALEHVDDMGFRWYYDWQSAALWDADPTSKPDASFVPMIWDDKSVTSAKLEAIAAASGNVLLGFNEPDNPTQGNMSVAQAIDLWPQLMATGKKLGSPATTTGQALGEGTWLDRFMDAALAKDYRVDFIAVHYYPETPDIDAFKSWLVALHEKYGKPIWVTEWALIDWNDTDRYSKAEIADFAREATLMMDDLSFVKRHAWFSSYDYDGSLRTELFDGKGNLTAIGEEFAELLGHTAATSRTFGGTTGYDKVVGTELSDTLSGGSGSDRLKGLGGKDALSGGGGNDLLRGCAGNDHLAGGANNDRLVGSWGNDTLDGGSGSDHIAGGAGKDRLAGGLHDDMFVFTLLSDSGIEAATRDRILDFAAGDRIDLSVIDAIAGGTDDSFVLDADGFFAAGEIRQTIVDGNLLVEANVDADSAADFSLMVNGRTVFLTGADFIL